MSTFTENYNLIKPQEEDYYDVQDFNENFDAIDAQMMATETAVAGVSEKIGTPTDSGTETMFGKMNQVVEVVNGISLIKSIQRFILSTAPNSGRTTISIKKVNPDRCIVLAQRLYNYEFKAVHTLSAEQLVVNHSAVGNGANEVIEYQIIEFY